MVNADEIFPKAANSGEALYIIFRRLTLTALGQSTWLLSALDQRIHDWRSCDRRVTCCVNDSLNPQRFSNCAPVCTPSFGPFPLVMLNPCVFACRLDCFFVVRLVEALSVSSPILSRMVIAIINLHSCAIGACPACEFAGRDSFTVTEPGRTDLLPVGDGVGACSTSPSLVSV